MEIVQIFLTPYDDDDDDDYDDFQSNLDWCGSNINARINLQPRLFCPSLYFPLSSKVNTRKMMKEDNAMFCRATVGGRWFTKITIMNLRSLVLSAMGEQLFRKHSFEGEKNLQSNLMLKW